MLEKVKELLRRIWAMLVSLVRGIGALFRRIWEMFVSLMRGIAAFFRRIWEMFVSLMRAIAGLLRRAWGMLVSLVRAIASLMRRIGQTLASWMRALASLMRRIALALASLMRRIGQTLASWMRALASLVRRIALALAALMRRIGQTLASWARAIAHAFASLMRRIWQQLVSWMRTLAGLLRRFGHWLALWIRIIAKRLDPRQLIPFLTLEDELDDRATLVVGGSVASIVLGVLYWVSRIGFTNPVLPVLDVIGMSLFVLAAPLWVMRFSQGRRTILEHWSASQPALTLLCLALLTMFGMLAHATGFAFATWVAVPGYVLALATIVIWFRHGKFFSTVLFLLGSAWFTAWTAAVVWGSRYKMPLFWETLMLRGNVHHDPLYYTSMANMLETYGVASIGIDGIPVAKYHYGSAWLFAKWAHLTGIDLLTFSSLGYPVIVVPLFFAAIVLLAIEIRSVLPLESERSLRADYRVWLVFLAATIGLIPTDALDGLAIWNANVLISESYLIAVPVFLMVLGAGIAFWRSEAYLAVAAADPEVPEAPPLRGQQRAAMAFLLAFLPMSLVVLGFLKLSLMMLLLGLILYVAFRLGIWRRWSVGLSLVLCALVSAMTYPVVAVAAQNGGFSPLNFMRYEVAEGWQQFFPLLNLMWTWIYVAGRFWEGKIGTARELKFALRTGTILDVELVFLIGLLGFLPGEILSIHGGSAVYFSDVQRWVALAFIIPRIGIWARKWRHVRELRVHNSPDTSGWRAVRLSTLLAIFVAAPFVVTLVVNSIQLPSRVARANIELRTEIASKGGGGLITDPAPLKRGLTRSAYYPVVTALRDMADLPLEERRTSALFIPQTYRDYWGMFDSDDRCMYVSLVAPSLSTIAMIDGMPAVGCRITKQYNMASYTPRTRPQLAADITPDALCRKARASGFTEVLVLAPDKKGSPRRSRIRCGS